MRPGFSVDLIASAQPSEGSWVAMSFASPRVGYVVAQRGALNRFTLSEDGSALEKMERVATPFTGANGLLVDGNTLYAVAEGEVSEGGGLWRLVDQDGDGAFEESRRLLEFGGGGEHGIHGIRKGADGWLYIIAGNHVPPPAWAAANSPVAHWGEDFLREREWDARGHAVGIMAPGGFVLRVDPSSCADAQPCVAQLWCAGMRNSYDLVQLPSGEWFTYDSDMEWDIGAPWYRHPRIVHLVSGGDSGWRSGSANSPFTYADHQAPVCETDESSPTGVEWGGGGSFPAAWRDRLLVGDWAYGRIVDVDLGESGAGYKGAWGVFASGRPMPVTDLAWGANGDLYYTTGGRGLTSGLYRVRVSDAELAAQPIVAEPIHGTVSTAANAEMVNTLRESRRALERFHTQGASDEELVTILRGLASQDALVAAAARVALEHQDVARWRTVAERAGPMAWLAFARVGTDADRLALLPLVADAASETGDTDGRALLARIATIALVRLEPGARASEAGVAVTAAVAAAMDGWYPSGDGELDELVLPILVEGRRAQVVERAMHVASKMDPAQALGVLLAVRGVRDGWTPETRAAFAGALARARGLRGGLSLQGFVDAIEADANSAFLAGTPEAQLTRPPAATAPAVPATLDMTGRSMHGWTVEELAGSLNFDARSRDLARGKRVFEQASCNLCHRVAGEGGSTGPDLTGAGNRLSRRDLVVTTLEPSLTVADQYADEMFTMKDGSIVIGRVVNETPTELEIRTNPLDDSRERIVKADLATRERSTMSPMPRGLLDAFNHGEIIDLLAYLESVK